MGINISKSKLEKFSRLQNRKFRIKDNLFIVEGMKVIESLLPAFEIENLIVPSARVGDIMKIPEDKILYASEREMSKISAFRSLPDAIAVFRIPPLRSDQYKIPEGKFYLALDDVQDPGNMGTIIRTAHWFGIKKIFCSRGCADVFSPKVVRSTMGSLASVEVIYCELESLIEESPNVPVYGLSLDGKNIYDTGKLKPGIILMGNEGHGINERLMLSVTERLLIPPAEPHNHPESLNVAIATAITLSQIINQ